MSEKRKPVVVDVFFPVETESGIQSESILTIWFQDDLLCEEILEANQCDSIIGMINEKLPEGTFLSDVPSAFELSKKNINLKVYRGIEIFRVRCIKSDF